jgi:hypothetical protein
MIPPGEHLLSFRFARAPGQHPNRGLAFCMSAPEHPRRRRNEKVTIDGHAIARSVAGPVRIDLQQLLAGGERALGRGLFPPNSKTTGRVDPEDDSHRRRRRRGTYTHPEPAGEKSPTLHVVGGPGRTVHELDVPAEYADIESAEELRGPVAGHPQ